MFRANVRLDALQTKMKINSEMQVGQFFVVLKPQLNFPVCFVVRLHHFRHVCSEFALH